MKLVISDPKTRRAWQIEKDLPILIGKKIGQTFDGSALGLAGFILKITGGSDKEGFPMKPDLPGVIRKKLLLASGPGYKPKQKGIKRRKYIRGNTISDAIIQVNCKIVEGEGDISSLLGIKKEGQTEKPEKEKEPTKEEKAEKPKEEVKKQEAEKETKPEKSLTKQEKKVEKEEKKK